VAVGERERLGACRRGCGHRVHSLSLPAVSGSALLRSCSLRARAPR
jgi:hypothetical protein